MKWGGIWYHYKKAGVCLERLIPKDSLQLDMFHQPSDETLEKTEQLMAMFDAINQKFGRSTIRVAAEGYAKPWAMRAQLKSPAYTTRWSDLRILLFFKERGKFIVMLLSTRI